ncbi:DUF1648 domain-containing protein [Gordonia sp. PKS22-38]|uniref:DUF1648 domain-containing protein n=1 Tax=Gordonia prachuapensis TaxID=3115651 RepID=A0ABU7MWQ5_9ACTN|nr:DUF1648 domain-containing protein [Gordonia sp. PKS22-38]
MTDGPGGYPATPGGPTGRTRAVVFLLATVPSLVAGIVGTLLVASWRAELPNPVATHWSIDGADGFSGHTFVIAAPIVVGAIGAVLGCLVFAATRDRNLVQSATGLVAGVSISIIAVVVLTTADQRDVTDASAVPTPQWQILCALGLGIVCGIGVAAATPRWSQAVADRDIGERPELFLNSAERFVWTRAVSMSATASVILSAALVVLATVSFVLGSWIVVAILAVVVILTALLWGVRVTVNRSGVTTRGLLGWPRTTVPIAEIDHAEVVPVRAMRDFGGYGYRIAAHGDLKGAKGFVLRSGSALLVVRRDGRRDIVVVDDAAKAAGLINHVARHGGPAAPR